jgi:hypothetical protein
MSRSQTSADEFSWSRIVPFAIVSLVGFVSGAGLLFLLLKSRATPLEPSLYYLVLIPFALSTAAFLFGALSSYAFYKGKVLNGTIRLGGPIVGFALVMIGGFVLPPRHDFDITVFVRGKEAKDLVLQRIGRVYLQLGADLRHEEIDDKGQVTFKNISSEFHNKSVLVWVEAADYESDTNVTHELDQPILTLTVHKKPGMVKGKTVEVAADGTLLSISNATVRVAGTDLRASTDSSGQFVLFIPGDQMARELLLEADAPDYSRATKFAAPGSDQVVLPLSRRRSR